MDDPRRDHQLRDWFLAVAGISFAAGLLKQHYHVHVGLVVRCRLGEAYYDEVFGRFPPLGFRCRGVKYLASSDDWSVFRIFLMHLAIAVAVGLIVTGIVAQIRRWRMHNNKSHRS
jgi:hypothetical protein